MFLHSVAVQDQLIGADTVQSFDLAVNPLSVVLIALRPLNDTGTLGNFQSYLGLCQALNRVTIMHRGESIISMRGEDLAAMNYFRYGIMPFQGQHADTDNDRRCAVLPAILGKFPYDKSSVFPASRRGELVLEMDIDIADTGYDGLRLSVETIEILDAKPTEFEKKVSIAQTFAATGDVDVDLPPGNLNRGILLFGTTGFAGATPAPSWGRVKVLLDNQEALYTATDFEVAQMLHCLWGRQPPQYDNRRTRVNATSGSSTEPTSGENFDIGAGWTQWAFLDFDPTRDDSHSLDTSGRSRFHIRANAETDDAVRAIPIEVIKV